MQFMWVVTQFCGFYQDKVTGKNLKFHVHVQTPQTSNHFFCGRGALRCMQLVRLKNNVGVELVTHYVVCYLHSART